MRNVITILLLVCIISPAFAYAATVPVNDPVPAKQVTFRNLTSADVERLTGRKLNFFQKIKLRWIQRKLMKFDEGTITEKQKRQAKASMILGISSLGLMVLPALVAATALAWIAIPAAILAIILGAKSLRGNKNRQGKIGVITGSITIIILLIVIAVLASAFSGLRFD